MSTIYTENGLYQLTPFSTEAELEDAIKTIRLELFGENRIYLDIKRKIGVRGIRENIPDGYLIDLSSKVPRLYLVENELVSHDAVSHIGKQIMNFHISFGCKPRKVRNILFDVLHSDVEFREICENYTSKYSYRNLDHLLDCLIEQPFSVLIIIDDENSKLENMVKPQFSFNVDVIYLLRYKNSDENCFYRFKPFLQDVIEDKGGLTHLENINPNEVDTVVVPARKGGFNDVFIKENRWYKLKMESSMREQIKYIACYQVSPVSAITHIANVESIDPWDEDGYVVLTFDGPAKEIKHIKLKRDGNVMAPRSHRYALMDKLVKAKSLDDIW